MAEIDKEKMREELNLDEKDFITDDWEVIRWADLTFDDDIKVEKKSEPIQWEVVSEVKSKPKGRQWRDRSPLYKWPDKLAMKKKLTEKQKVFVDHYLKTMNATESYRASKWILDKPDLWSRWDTGNGRSIKNMERVKQYLNEKILTSADELLDIQMDIIKNEKMPPAVRMDWIKDRLNRLGIWKEKDEWVDFWWIWEITITIKKPEVVEPVVEVLDDNKEDGETISASVWDDWEASTSVAVSNW